jgi:hypothetical protein
VSQNCLKNYMKMVSQMSQFEWFFEQFSGMKNGPKSILYHL